MHTHTHAHAVRGTHGHTTHTVRDTHGRVRPHADTHCARYTRRHTHTHAHRRTQCVRYTHRHAHSDAANMLWISVTWAVVLGHCWLARCYDLTAEDQDVIVERHNHFRSQVMPSATNMKQMSWDDSLAQVAAGYVTKCIWEHNPDLEDLGENLYATSGPFNASKAVTGWYMEHLDYTYHNNSCEEGQLCGHYTQVVWADTTMVGCSTHLCEEMQGLTLGQVTLLVCNYAPAGNYIGELPYEAGEPCSNCPAGLQYCESNMCVAESPSVREGTTEGPQPGTPSAPPADHSPTDGPAVEVDESPAPEADEPVTPPEEEWPPSDTSSPPFISHEKVDREEGMTDGQGQSMSAGTPLCSSALLLAPALLLAL